MAPPVVIDCDPGFDDAMAILLAIRAAKEGIWDLKAITIVNGNCTVEKGCINALRVQEAANFKVEVFPGCSSAMIHQNIEDPDRGPPFHGYDGFGDMDYPQPKETTMWKNDTHAVTRLLELARQYQGELTVIALGPLTNIATAMNIDVHFASRIKELHVMGGNTKGIGNTSSNAEFNFFKDSEAAFVVFDRVQCPLYLSPWELCMYHTIQPLAWRTEVLGKIDSSEARLMNLLEYKHVYASEPVRELMQKHGYVMCDQIAMAIALNPQIVTRTSQCHATVELSGKETRGQVVIDHRGLKRKPNNVTIVEQVDIPTLQKIMQWGLGCPETVVNF